MVPNMELHSCHLHHIRGEPHGPKHRTAQLGCARFTENLSELTKTWILRATECGV